ncbi:MAG: hypothetical protein OWT27_00645, partial [Firmicutes bacterium]|nr:hypothetical protein [Bacillota bacterium]
VTPTMGTPFDLRESPGSWGLGTEFMDLSAALREAKAPQQYPLSVWPAMYRAMVELIDTASITLQPDGILYAHQRSTGWTLAGPYGAGAGKWGLGVIDHRYPIFTPWSKVLNRQPEKGHIFFNVMPANAAMANEGMGWPVLAMEFPTLAYRHTRFTGQYTGEVSQGSGNRSQDYPHSIRW